MPTSSADSGHATNASGHTEASRSELIADHGFALTTDAWLFWAQQLARNKKLDADIVEGGGFYEEGRGESHQHETADLDADAQRYHGYAVQSNGHIVSACYQDSSNFWESHNPSTSTFLQVWHDRRPGGFVYSLEENRSCLMNDGFVNDPAASESLDNPWRGFQVLALIKKSFDEICASDELNFQWVLPESFPVSGPLKRNGNVRNYAVVWPGNHTCTKDNPCPMVVFLSGIGEHSPGGERWGNTTEMRNSFRTLHKFGFLRYWDRDPDCATRLGSILLFPELSREENWVKDGPMLIEYFVVPLINHVRRPHPMRIDGTRLAIMGYSEGAFGALHGAALYPHVFSFAIAASASMSFKWWQDMPQTKSNPSPALLKAWKLDLVMIAFGELDNTGNQSYNLERCLHYLDEAHVTPYTTVQVRYYAGLYHKEVWDRLFNRWPLFHRVFWQGRFHESKELSLKQTAFHEILEMEEGMLSAMSNPVLPPQ